LINVALAPDILNTGGFLLVILLIIPLIPNPPVFMVGILVTYLEVDVLEIVLNPPILIIGYIGLATEVEVIVLLIMVDVPPHPFPEHLAE